MTYPKLSELKATKGLSANDLSIKTSIYITGGFLDKAFCDVLDHYLKTVKIFPEIIFDHWKPTWRSIYSPRHFENIEAKRGYCNTSIYVRINRRHQKYFYSCGFN